MTCRCGHDRDAHRHYTPGTYCGLCDCQQYRPRAPWRTRWRNLIRRLTR